MKAVPEPVGLMNNLSSTLPPGRIYFVYVFAVSLWFLKKPYKVKESKTEGETINDHFIIVFPSVFDFLSHKKHQAVLPLLSVQF